MPKETSNENQNNNLQKAFAEIDSETLKKLRSVIATNQNSNEDSSYVCEHSDPFYWRKAANIRSEGSLFDINYDKHTLENHKVGQYYHNYGMHILPDKDQYKGLKEVMDYIKNNKDSSLNIHEICKKQQESLDKEKMLTSHGLDKEVSKDLILFAGHKYKMRQEHRSEYEMDTIEEFYIKALAVSIMAESDGKSEVARSILDNGGMEIIKNIEPKSVKDLLLDLQVIALDGEETENQNNNEHSR